MFAKHTLTPMQKLNSHSSMHWRNPQMQSKHTIKSEKRNSPPIFLRFIAQCWCCCHQIEDICTRKLTDSRDRSLHIQHNKCMTNNEEKTEHNKRMEKHLAGYCSLAGKLRRSVTFFMISFYLEVFEQKNENERETINTDKSNRLFQ